MKLFPPSTMTSRTQQVINMLMVGAVFIAATTGTSSAFAERTYTTVVRETVYIYPPRVSVYIAPSVVYREVIRHDNRYHTNYYRGHDYGRDKDYRHHPVWGYTDRGHHDEYRNQQPVRGRWSGSDRRRDVIYIEKGGRRNSSYRETERRSVEIRDRSR